MSHKLLDQAYGPDILTLGLDEHALGVYRVLCNAHNGETGRCDPSTETIAAMLAVSTKTVKRAYSTLRDAGLIETTEKRDEKRHVRGLAFTVLAVPVVEPEGLSVPQHDDLRDCQSAPEGLTVQTRGTDGPSHKRKNQEENQEVEPGGARERAHEPSTADVLMSDWIASYKTKPLAVTVRDIRRQVNALLAEGADPEFIAAGLQRWRGGTFSPSMLPRMVQDCINAAEAPALQVRNRAKQRQTENLAVIAELAALDAARDTSAALALEGAR